MTASLRTDIAEILDGLALHDGADLLRWTEAFETPDDVEVHDLENRIERVESALEDAAQLVADFSSRTAAAAALRRDVAAIAKRVTWW